GKVIIVIDSFVVLFPREKEPKTSWLRIFEIRDRTKDGFLHTSNIRTLHLGVNRGWCILYSLLIMYRVLFVQRVNCIAYYCYKLINFVWCFIVQRVNCIAY